MITRLPAFLILVAGIPLAGCASSSADYPSLAIRDAERASGSLDAPSVDTPAPVPAPLAASVVEQIARLEAEARSAHGAFLDASPAARQSAQRAGGAAITSNAWADAQVSLGNLDSIRSRTAIALGDLDLLFVDATLGFEQREAIGVARAKVVELVREEDRILSELRGMIAR